MPTIDQLAPATAASDSDALISSQNGIARKVTRAQLIAGLQPELSLSSGVLLGRSSAGAGAPEAISVGPNLLLNAGTISAAATPFAVGALPAGVVPTPGDLVPLSQGGTNVAVTYGQFASSLAELSGLDASSMTVSIAGKVETLAAFAANAVSVGGATMTGPLVLDAMPAAPLQAAPKQYVDNQITTALPVVGGTLTGALAGTVASFSGPLSVGGTLSCAGAISAAGLTATGMIVAQSGATMTGGVLQLSQYSVSSLPSSSPGALAYASNGRKPGEPAGAGTGVVVWSSNGSQWLSLMSGTPVQV